MEIDVGICITELRFNDGIAVITEDYFTLSCGELRAQQDDDTKEQV